MQDRKRLEDDRGRYSLNHQRPFGWARRDKPGRMAANARGNKMHTPIEIDAHCRKPGCNCGHVICYRGWIDTDQTSPCQFCRPETHERWLMACQARQKGYPVEAVHRILAGRRA